MSSKKSDSLLTCPNIGHGPSTCCPYVMYGGACPSGARSKTPVMIAINVASPVSRACAAICSSSRNIGRVTISKHHQFCHAAHERLSPDFDRAGHKILGCYPRTTPRVMTKCHPTAIGGIIIQFARWLSAPTDQTRLLAGEQVAGSNRYKRE